MDWLTRMQQQAQEAAEKLISSEAAEKARQLATQATQQAAVLAQQATIKAQEVAKEAIGEAEKSISAFRHKGQEAAPAEADPVQFGITPELERFVCSLTYSTFSEYPLDSLDVPPAAEEQRLNSWQETHARLMLQRVQQLQDLRFVLCPKRMDEYTFWLIYFTLCKRYLPQQEHQVAEPQPAPPTPGSAPANTGTAAAGGAGAAAAGQGYVADTAEQPQAASASTAGLSPSATAPAPTDTGVSQPPSSPGAAAGGTDADAAASTGAGNQDDEDLTELADDPELTAYLQDALQLDNKAGNDESGELGSDVDDLDDYLTQLDAEVNAPK